MGRVPRLRGWHHAGRAPDLVAGRPSTWSERCRHLYADFGVDYEAYALGTLADRCLDLPLR